MAAYGSANGGAGFGTLNFNKNYNYNVSLLPAVSMCAEAAVFTFREGREICRWVAGRLSKVV